MAVYIERGFSMVDAIWELSRERKDEIFVALLDVGLKRRPRAATVSAIVDALGKVEGPAWLATFANQYDDDHLPSFIATCRRIDLPEDRYSRLLLLA